MRTADIMGVIDLLGLNIRPRTSSGAQQIRVRCPFCDDTRYSMGINKKDNVYNCWRCGEHGGYLNLYSTLRLGETVRSGPNGNGRQIYQKLCEDLGVVDTSEMMRERQRRRQALGDADVHRASDDVVHRTYSQLLSYSEFNLRLDHLHKLLARGLTMPEITRNGYRSFLFDKATKRKLIQPKNREVFERYLLPVKRKNDAMNDYFSDEKIIAGVKIADRLLHDGCKLQGVPGFFKVGKKWCFNLEEGMYVPTRNPQGQIVCLQARKDFGNLRYMTISSKNFPEGVNVDVARTHFPLANTQMPNKDTKVYITEGPLKADVAMSLMDEENVMFLAIHGVNNVAELPKLFDYLRQFGIRHIVNAFDADKDINVNVARAGRTLRDIAREHGLEMSYRFWGDDEAQRLLKIALPICESNGLKINATGNVHVDLALCVQALERKHIKAKNVGIKWADDCKGIDDVLFRDKMAKNL